MNGFDQATIEFNVPDCGLSLFLFRQRKSDHVSEHALLVQLDGKIRGEWQNKPSLLRRTCGRGSSTRRHRLGMTFSQRFRTL